VKSVSTLIIKIPYFLDSASVTIKFEEDTFLLSSEMGFGKTTESTEDTEKTATLRVLCG
jgi:hypothetical protein